VEPELAVLPDGEGVSTSDEEPLGVVGVGVETEELPLELDPVVPLDVSLALCANAGSSGMTIASVKMVKKTAHPVTVRRKKL